MRTNPAAWNTTLVAGIALAAASCLQTPPATPAAGTAAGMEVISPDKVEFN